MNRPPEQSPVWGWIEKAEHDWRAAVHSLELAEEGLTDIVCYHCQQTAEKYLKALLIAADQEFPKTHDLRLLLDKVEKRYDLGIGAEQVIPLNRYLVECRYPGDWEPITVQEAKQAIEMARKVRGTVRSLLGL
jgi:HEPN domain-containing protein